MTFDQAFVNEVRLRVLAVAANTTEVPGAAEVARALGVPAADVVEAFRQLG